MNEPIQKAVKKAEAATGCFSRNVISSLLKTHVTVLNVAKSLVWTHTEYGVHILECNSNTRPCRVVNWQFIMEIK